MSKSFQLRPHFVNGLWETNDGRYREYAHELLGELERLCLEVKNGWPESEGAAIRDQSVSPELWNMCHIRDRLSDTTRIYAAMAVEGYLNFYGVLRLGQEVFDEHFERLGLVPKLRQLLLICDDLDVAKNDSIVLALDALARSRNSLVHPKTREISGEPSKYQRSSTPIPDTAREAVANMEEFFTQFVLAVPLSKCQLHRGTATSKRRAQ